MKSFNPYGGDEFPDHNHRNHTSAEFIRPADYLLFCIRISALLVTTAVDVLRFAASLVLAVMGLFLCGIAYLIEGWCLLWRTAFGPAHRAACW